MYNTVSTLAEFVLNILEAMLGPHIILGTGKNHIRLVLGIGGEEDAQLSKAIEELLVQI